MCGLVSKSFYLGDGCFIWIWKSCGVGICVVSLCFCACAVWPFEYGDVLRGFPLVCHVCCLGYARGSSLGFI